MNAKKVTALSLAALLCATCAFPAFAEEADTESTTEAVTEAADTEGTTEAVTGAAAEEAAEDELTEEEKAMCAGYYNDTSTGLMSFIHFNEDGTYYSKYFDGSVQDAGLWDLLDEEMEYYVDGGADEDYNTPEDNTTAMAEQVVQFTSYKSGAPVKVAYVDDQMVDISLAGLANHRTMTHDPEYEYDPAVEEIAIEIYVFYANHSIGSNFILKHDRTFMDATGDVIANGTWKMTGEGEYSLVYDSGDEATLTVDADGKYGTVAMADGTALELCYTYEEIDEAEAVVVMTAEDCQVGLPMGVTLRLDCYADETCTLYMEIAQTGAEVEVDKGTYSVSEAMKYTFTFEKAGELVSEPDYAGATAEGMDMTLAYKVETEVEAGGGSATAISVDTVLSGRINAQ